MRDESQISSVHDAWYERSVEMVQYHGGRLFPAWFFSAAGILNDYHPFHQSASSAFDISFDPQEYVMIIPSMPNPTSVSNPLPLFFHGLCTRYHCEHAHVSPNIRTSIWFFTCCQHHMSRWGSKWVGSVFVVCKSSDYLPSFSLRHLLRPCLISCLLTIILLRART